MATRKLKVIVYEDDPTIGALLSQVLSQKGHEVFTFPDPTFCPACRDHMSECPQESPCADVIISDHNMPNMTGIDFLSHQRSLGCKVPDENKAIVTGALLNRELQGTIDALGCKVFKKPFKLAEILKWVDECASRLA